MSLLAARQRVVLMKLPATNVRIIVAIVVVSGNYLAGHTQARTASVADSL